MARNECLVEENMMLSILRSSSVDSVKKKRDREEI